MPRRPLMVRAALLRRSCDGVAAATEMRRPAPSRSFCASLPQRSSCCCELRRSCDGVAAATELRRPLLLRVASRRDALNEEPASFPPGLIQISMVVAHSPRPPPWPRDKNERGRRLGTYLRRFLPCTGTMLETTFLKDSECRPNVLTLDWPKPYVLTLEFRPPPPF